MQENNNSIYFSMIFPFETNSYKNTILLYHMHGESVWYTWRICLMKQIWINCDWKVGYSRNKVFMSVKFNFLKLYIKFVGIYFVTKYECL